MAILLHKWLLMASMLLLNGHPGADRHPFYVSVVEINHNADNKTLEISCKIFTDDFETTLEKLFQRKVDLYRPDTAQVNKEIFTYVQKHLSIKVDGRPVQMQFVGFEREQEATWSYYQVNNVAAPHKIELENSILYDAFDKQINIMHVSVNGDRKSNRLIYPATHASFDFSK